MDTVKVKLNDGKVWPHMVTRMPGDGSCLFYSISYALYGTITVAYAIREEISQYVYEHWDGLQAYTTSSNNIPYPSKEAYREAMRLSSTYGATSELTAAGELYPYTFEVYGSGYQGGAGDGSLELLGVFGGSSGGSTRRLRFSGPDSGGHYDYLTPLSENHQLSTSDLKSQDNTKQNAKKIGRPTKSKRGRPKQSDISRSEQLQLAAARYRENHPDRRRETKAKYEAAHPEVHRKAVANYDKSHPEVNQKAVARYTEAHPEVNQKAVARYTEAHPEVNQKAVARYNQLHPKVHQEAVARYATLHPEINQKAARMFRSNKKLQLKPSEVEKIKNDLCNLREDIIEVENVIKWAIYNRQATVGNLNKTVKKLQQIVLVGLERLRVCPQQSDIGEKFTALLGKSEHRSNQEPFYAEQSYQIYQDKDKPIAIDLDGKAVLADIEKKLNSFVWPCREGLCVFNLSDLSKLQDLFSELSDKSPAQIYSEFTEKESLSEYISFINNIKAHFPKLRTIVRNLYQILSDCKLIQTLDDSLYNRDFNKIKDFSKQSITGTVVITTEEKTIEKEDDIIDKFKCAFQSFYKKLKDTPKHECISCNKLLCMKDVSSIKKLRKPLISDVWMNIKEYYTLHKLPSSPYICHSCILKIRANQLPSTCFLNDMFVDDIPPEVSQLNDYERLLIQRAKAFQVVVSMTPVANKRLPTRQMTKKVKGRTFHLPLPLEQTLKKLPSPEEPININHELYIMVRSTPSKSKIVWEDLVDVNKIFSALSVLKNLNTQYATIKLPRAPQQLLDNLNEFNYTTDAQVPDDDSEINADAALLTQITTETETDYEQYTIYPLYEKKKQNLPASKLYQMLRVNAAPIDSRDKELDLKCFPHLFITGRYGQCSPRPVKITSSEYIKARLMNKHSHFRLNIQYLFYLLNDANFRQLSSGIFYKMNTFNQKEKMTAAKYLSLLDKDELEGNLTAIFSRLRNTEQFWRKPRNDVNCMTLHYGPATWFLTLSPSEWNWHDLGEYIKEVNGISSMENKCVSELVASDPISASRFIDNAFHAVLDFLTSSDEPLGKVEHYFWRREYQSRGAQHFHMMLWIKDAPILHKSSHEEVAAFLSKYISCNIPEKNISPTLHSRVTSYQSHKHNNYCMRKKKTRSGFVSVCRFGFPRLVTDQIIIRDTVESIAARKTLSSNNRLYHIVRKKGEEMINDYNPAVLLAWNGNVDIQYVGEKTTILNYYITKYTTKSEKTHATSIIDEVNSSKGLTSRLYNIGLRVLSNRECGALEASDTLLGISLYGSDPKTTIRWLDINIHRNRRVKPKKVINELDKDSTEIFYESWIDSFYPQRPQELNNMCLYEFMKNFDTVKTRPVSQKVKYFVLGDGKQYLKQRERPYLINHYNYDLNRMPENFYFSLLLMFKPWRTIEELKDKFNSYTEAFNYFKDDLKEAEIYGNLRTEQRNNIDKAFELVAEKVAELTEANENEDVTEGPENPLEFEVLEAEHAMEDLQDIAENDKEEDLNVMLEKLNTDQKRVFDMVIYKLESSHEILRVFISGTGGTGKSFLIKCLKAFVKHHMHKKVAVSAPTGIAAFNVNGLTIHRLLQLPVEHKATPKYRPLSDEVLKVLRADWKDVILLIVDEVSMISNVTLAYIHLRLTEIFDTSDDENGWFGKRHLLLLGDLLQLPPVRERSPFEKLTASETNKLLGSLSVPNLWVELFTYDELLINMRQLNDSKFAEILQRIRIGLVTQEDLQILRQRLIILTSSTNDGKLKEISTYLSSLPNDTVCLLPTRNMCQQLNEAMLQTIPHPEIKLVATDSIDCPKFLTKRAHDALKKCEDDDSMTAGLEETIIIKEGVRVMLKRNIDISLGLVNGSIGTVIKVKYDTNNIKAKRVVIHFSDCIHELAPVKTKFEIINRAFIHREQFPICVAYAITIHKSQGLSLSNALIDIGSSVFSCGQAYVALSRLTSLDGVHLINLDSGSIKAQKCAISEYNRLRTLYRPDLSEINSQKVLKRRNKDREWAIRKTIAVVQSIVPEKKKKKISKKK